MKHIKTKIILLTTLCIIAAAVVIGSFSAWMLYTSNANQLTALKAEMLSSYDEKIQFATQSVTTQLKGVKNQVTAGLITPEEAKIIGADIVRNAAYGEGGYFFVYGLDGSTIVLLGDKAIEGSNRLNLKDANGKMIVQEFIAIAKKDGAGFSEYYYPKKGETEALPKRAYVQLDSDLGWIIGTGNYIDDIDKAVAVASEESMKQLRTKMLFTLGISLLIVAAGIVAAFITGTSISDPIVRITKLIHQTAKLDMTYDDSFTSIYKYKDETGVMAHAVADLRENLRDLVKMLHDDSVSLAEASQHLSNISNSVSDSIVAVASAVSETAQGAQSQAEDAQESTEKLHLLSMEIEKTVENSSNLKELTKVANEKSKHGSGQVRSLTTEFQRVENITGELEINVNRLSDKSAEISSIVNTIQSIAE